MSDILCKWLNEELQLSKTVEPKTLARTFSNGYLIGEVLHKYQLQSDFSMFTKKETSISKVNNFTRLEPTLQLLGISFNMNTAQDLMQEKQGVATHLLYQLYVSLVNKKKAEVSGTMMEIMQPSATAGLPKKEHELYSDPLHQVIKRDAELKLPKITEHSEEKCQQLGNKSAMTHSIQQSKPFKDETRITNTEKLQVRQQKGRGIVTNKQAALVQVPRPPPYSSQLNLKKRQQQQRREQQAQIIQNEIAQFETNRKKALPYGSPFSGVPPGGSSCGVPGSGMKLVLQSSSKYIQDIRQRLEETAPTREQREKRVNRFLMEQLKAHEAQEEARRDDQLAKRLTRQTQEEQRLAVQLLLMRRQVEVIRNNRLYREQQLQQRRERDFQEALEREAALAQQAKLALAEEIKQEHEFCSRMAAERAQSRYKKHFTICKEIVEQIVDLTTKVGEYRLLAGNLIPAKVMREWKELLFSGLPLYEPIQGQQPGFEFSTPLDPVELKKQDILNNQDYDEYTSMAGEWAWPEEAGEAKLPLENNNILGHVVQRLRNIVRPTIAEPSSPSVPHFTLKACVLGKFCSGKTTCLAKIAQAHSICVLSTSTLIEEALNAYKNQDEVQGGKDAEQQDASSTLLKPDLASWEENRDSSIHLSTRVRQGAAAEEELRKGKAISNEQIVDMIAEAIRQLPAHSGWILDGFPNDINQAYLLEKALGGSVDEGNEVTNSRTNLAPDPDPPAPPPPPAPVLDVALLLDVPDECAVTRAYTNKDTESSVTSRSDRTLFLAQTPHRITDFQETWPKLEEWFGGQQNILIRIDANVDEEELHKNVESALLNVMLQRQKVSDATLESLKAPESSSSASPSPMDRSTAIKDQTLNRSDSCLSLEKEKAPRVKSLSTSAPNTPRGHSSKPSTSSSSLPGSPSSAYVDEPLPPEIPEFLCSYWDASCDSYVKSVKTVMQQLHSQRTIILHHLHNIKEEYKRYLGRPDMRQEFVSCWQKDFNSIAEDMREDEDTKSELHLRLDELLERLWDISDKRKEGNEQERAALGEGWLADHSAFIINSHSLLIQVELNRFYNTLHILRVYYKCMHKQGIPELPSNFVCLPLLKRDQNERSEPADASACHQREDRELSKFIHFLPRCADSSLGASNTKGPDQTQPAKPPNEKLISDYEEAITTISKLVAAEAHQGETTEQDEKPVKKKMPKAPASAKKKENRKQSSKKAKDSSNPSPASSPAQADESGKNDTNEVMNKINQEYIAALSHEENAAKVRIALVKGHGQMMLHSLRSRAEQALSIMEKWLQEHYLTEIKSLDQLTAVARHHIEAGTKLQEQAVLEVTDFYLSGDHHMVASQAPPPCRSLEKQQQSTSTINQLEALHQQLCTVAPTGLISSFEFSRLLMDSISSNTLPETWTCKNETQLMEMVSLLEDNYGLVDWHRFLLSAALPWPYPSLTQLLAVLQRFKAADTGHTGYIDKEQYQQAELWFSKESVQPIPEDPSELLPDDGLANLHMFFFQLFADHSISPPQLDYVSMLQYFAADPNPKEGFLRALSVVSGHHLKHSSTDHLVKSMPSIEEATELSTSDVDGEYKEEETQLCLSSSSFGKQEVSISALLTVICHKVTKMKDGNLLPPGYITQQEHTARLVDVFKELGYKPEDCVPFSILSQHPFIQEMMATSFQHQLVNIHRVLLTQPDEEEANSFTGP